VIGERVGRSLAAERQIGRLLIAITYLSVGLLVVGVALLFGAGVSPLAGGPGLDLASLGDQLARLDPAGFLWLGLLAVISAPMSRVLLAAIAYGREGDWSMVAIALAILAIIVVGVVTAWAGTV
jgi:uncharacterized membrane protein